MTVISVSLTYDLLERLDDFVEKSGYSSRSEALRLAIRDSLNQYSLNRMEKGTIMSTVILLLRLRILPGVIASSGKGVHLVYCMDQ